MSDTMTGIPTVDLKLPISGQTVVLYSYITMGQQRELQRILMPEGTFDMEGGQVKSKGFTMDNFDKWQLKSMEFLIKELKTSDGSKPFSQEWFNDLPLKDGQALYNKVGEIVGGSNLLEADKKK